MSDPVERIEYAACRFDGIVYSVERPGRHADVHNQIRSITGRDEVLGDEQGFMTSFGRFVDRETAATLAVVSGQIDEPQWGPELYSEDLW